MKESLRDNILEAICKHDQDRFGVDMSGKRKIDIDKAADDLLQFLCYREVKACLEYVGLEDLCPEHEDGLVMQLMIDYPTKMIWEAIEQYKSEHI